MRKYKDFLYERLKNLEEAAAYLNAALEDEECPGIFLVALRDVALANGGMMLLAKDTSLNREALYRTLSKKGNPTLVNLRSLLKTIGLEISIQPASKSFPLPELSVAEEECQYLTLKEAHKKKSAHQKEMKLAAKELRFEDAAKERDLMRYYQNFEKESHPSSE